MSSKVVLDIIDISKDYNLNSNNFFFKNEKKILKISALKNISLQIMQTDRVGIIGRNGSGKSTLCKIISGITHPSEGIVKVKGKVSSVLEAGTGFEPELTGYENIFVGGAVLGMSRNKIIERINEIIKFSEIEEYINIPLKKYSSGMIIKLAFSVASFLDGEIVILDEILAVADEKFRKKCIQKIIKDCKETYKTLLLVSHDLRNIIETCNKVIYLKNGQLVSFGNAEETILEYEKEI
jgi:lipopolysaccharide transport system ATP-binding protein